MKVIMLRLMCLLDLRLVIRILVKIMKILKNKENSSKGDLLRIFRVLGMLDHCISQNLTLVLNLEIQQKLHDLTLNKK
jgi:hypothetical protein